MRTKTQLEIKLFYQINPKIKTELLYIYKDNEDKWPALYWEQQGIIQVSQKLHYIPIRPPTVL